MLDSEAETSGFLAFFFVLALNFRGDIPFLLLLLNHH